MSQHLFVRASSFVHNTIILLLTGHSDNRNRTLHFTKKYQKSKISSEVRDCRKAAIHQQQPRQIFLNSSRSFLCRTTKLHTRTRSNITHVNDEHFQIRTALSSVAQQSRDECWWPCTWRGSRPHNITTSQYWKNGWIIDMELMSLEKLVDQSDCVTMKTCAL